MMRRMGVGRAWPLAGVVVVASALAVSAQCASRRFPDGPNAGGSRSDSRSRAPDDG